MEKRRNKKGIISDYLPWLLLAILMLVVLVVGIFLLKGKGLELVTNIKNFFRIG